jgi:hypothetical protein
MHIHGSMRVQRIQHASVPTVTNLTRGANHGSIKVVADKDERPNMLGLPQTRPLPSVTRASLSMMMTRSPLIAYSVRHRSAATATAAAAASTVGGWRSRRPHALLVQSPSLSTFLNGSAKKERLLLQCHGSQGLHRTRVHAVQSACLSTSSESSSTASAAPSSLVYDSPFSNVVNRLRFMSVTTGVLGSVGLPILISLKPEMPEAGILVAGVAFLTGSLGSTAIIHTVFGPYVYKIEQIPVRKCHSPSIESKESAQADASTESGGSQCSNPKPVAGQKYLYKTITKGLFLNRIETVFDLCDVKTYSGLRPMCNFVSKERVFYVHPEFVMDPLLKQAIRPNSSPPIPPKDNPDDFL